MKTVQTSALILLVTYLIVNYNITQLQQSLSSLSSQQLLDSRIQPRHRREGIHASIAINNSTINDTTRSLSPTFAWGIFSTQNDTRARSLLRSTMLNHSHLCPLIVTREPKCRIRYAFVVGGNPSGPTERIEGEHLLMRNHSLHQEPDVLYLNIRENMNEGKTPTWFAYASTLKDIDFIVKSDMDTMVDVTLWLSFATSYLSSLPIHQRIYAGRMVDFWKCHEATRSSACSQNRGRSKNAKVYAMGQFIMLSSDLAQQYRKLYPTTSRTGLHEDMDVGEVVRTLPPFVRFLPIHNDDIFWIHKIKYFGQWKRHWETRHLQPENQTATQIVRARQALVATTTPSHNRPPLIFWGILSSDSDDEDRRNLMRITMLHHSLGGGGNRLCKFSWFQHNNEVACQVHFAFVVDESNKNHTRAAINEIDVLYLNTNDTKGRLARKLLQTVMTDNKFDYIMMTHIHTLVDVRRLLHLLDREQLLTSHRNVVGSMVDFFNCGGRLRPGCQPFAGGEGKIYIHRAFVIYGIHMAQFLARMEYSELGYNNTLLGEEQDLGAAALQYLLTPTVVNIQSSDQFWYFPLGKATTWIKFWNMKIADEYGLTALS